MQNQLETAIALACEAHRGQVDKAGQPYILHPLRVMLRGQTPAERIVAVLHDVVEDTAITLDELLARGFDPSIVAAVGCLTKQPGESYDAFIDRVTTNPLATRVKLLDITDNLDIYRLDSLNDSDLQRIAKYHRAHRTLQGVIASSRGE